MSHYTVMVIGDDIEDKLYPFHELECTLSCEEIKDDPRGRFEIIIPRDEIRQYIHDEIFMEKYGDKAGKRRRVYSEIQTNTILDETNVVVRNEFIPKYYEYLKNKDYDSIMDGWEGFTKDEHGNYGRWTNPDAKWDWYQIGGRWLGSLKLKKLNDVPKEYRKLYEYTDCGESGVFDNEVEDGYVDQAANILIDWESMNKSTVKQRKRDYDFWTKYVIPFSKKEFLTLPEDVQKTCMDEVERELDIGYIMYRASYYKERYKNRENYIRLNNLFSTYAVITEDGIWHAPGEMGWFGASSESHEDASQFYDTFYDKFIKPLSPETTITIVDCHI